MLLKIFQLVFLVVIKPVESDHDLHSSLVQLKQLWLNEIEAIHMLEKVFQQITTTQSVIKEYLEDFQKLNLHVQQNADFLDNPVNAFLFLRHIGFGWKHIEEVLRIQRALDNDIIDPLLSRGKKKPLPDETDVDGASLAIGRLHATYKLNLTALTSQSAASLRAEVNGNNVNYTTLCPLSVWELTKIGLDSFNIKMYDVGVDFLSVALQKLQISPNLSEWKYFDISIDVQRIQNFYQSAIRIHDQTLETKGFKTNKHTTHRRPVSAALAIKKKYQNIKEIEPILYSNMKSSKKRQLQEKFSLTSESREEYQATRLCRGDELRGAREKARLFCSYFHNDWPWLRIGPLRGEVQSLQPYVVQFHRMLSEEQCDKTIKFMGTKLVTPDVTKNLKKWTLKHNWKKEDDFQVFAYLTKKIEAIAGVAAQSDTHAERFMVTNYGVGGSFKIHTDYFSGGDFYSRLPLTGDRIATFMTYLEAPESGGATVWPWIGLAVKPIKGSAVLWWNLFPSGIGDKITRHMACPVLFGSKWIGNKWIGYDAQWNKIQCSVEMDSRIRIPFH